MIAPDAILGGMGKRNEDRAQLARVGAMAKHATGKAVVVDCALIPAIGLEAQAPAFTSKMGRAIVCTDSYQYVAAAEALLDPEQVPQFDKRKPGYPFFLAGVWAVAVRYGNARLRADIVESAARYQPLHHHECRRFPSSFRNPTCR